MEGKKDGGEKEIKIYFIPLIHRIARILAFVL